MTFRVTLLILFFAGVSSSLAMADSGTKEQQAACRPDVRRFCSKVAADAGDTAFEDCLQLHRDKLTLKCQHVLAGQPP